VQEGNGIHQYLFRSLLVEDISSSVNNFSIRPNGKSPLLDHVNSAEKDLEAE
jgi:hypothetical protein